MRKLCLCFLLAFVSPLPKHTCTVVCVVKFHFYFDCIKLFSHFRGLVCTLRFTRLYLETFTPLLTSSRAAFFLLLLSSRSSRSVTHRILPLTQLLLPLCNQCVRDILPLPGHNQHGVEYYFNSWQHCVRVQGPIIETWLVAAVSNTIQHNSWLLMDLNLVVLFRVYHNNIFICISSTSAGLYTMMTMTAKTSIGWVYVYS